MVLILTILTTLVGCGKAPDPTIKEGRFNFSVTYEIGGEQKTISSVYACEFEEFGMLMDGWYITWNAYVEDSEIEALFHDESYYGGIVIGSNEYGTIYLDLSLDAGYLMVEPGCENREYNPHVFIRYNEETAEKLDTYQENAPYFRKLRCEGCQLRMRRTY